MVLWFSSTATLTEIILCFEITVNNLHNEEISFMEPVSDNAIHHNSE